MIVITNKMYDIRNISAKKILIYTIAHNSFVVVQNNQRSWRSKLKQPCLQDTKYT